MTAWPMVDGHARVWIMKCAASTSAVRSGQVHSRGRNVAVQLLRVAHRGRDRVPGGEGQVEEMAADAPCRSDDRDASGLPPAFPMI